MIAKILTNYGSLGRWCALVIARSVAVSLLALPLVSCTKSPYESYCKQVENDSELHERCLADEQVRQRLVAQRVDSFVGRATSMLEMMPSRLLSDTLTTDIRESATRIAGGKEMPVELVSFDKTQETHAELVGQYFVIDAAIMFMMDNEDSAPSLILSDPARDGDLVFLDGDRLTSGQTGFIETICVLGNAICRGDIYFQVLPSEFLNILQPYVVGADIDPIEERALRSSHREYLEKYLRDLGDKSNEEH